MSFVEVSNVYKAFGKEPVLRDVNLKVERSEVAVLVGPSGSGKSTLLRCLNGLEGVESGRIAIDGQTLPTRRADVRRWRENIGFVFQSYNLFPHLTAEANIALSLRLVKGTSKDEALSTARSLLDEVGLLQKAKSYPDSLSGGQQQRVAIARALAMKPALMVFDEPTSALDPELTGEVVEVMTKLARGGMTMIVVTHEMRFVRKLADSVHFLMDGAVLEEGSPEKIFGDPESPECKRFVDSIVN